MRVLGIDPGLTRCGWGVVEGRPGARPTAVGVGVSARCPSSTWSCGCCELHTAVTALCASTGPTSWPSSGSSASTTRARRWAPRRPPASPRWPPPRPTVPVAWHTPSEVKAAITGTGRADKDQVTHGDPGAGLADGAQPADAADALALAICHVWRGPAQDRLRAAALAGGIGAPVRPRTLPRWTGVAADDDRRR